MGIVSQLLYREKCTWMSFIEITLNGKNCSRMRRQFLVSLKSEWIMFFSGVFFKVAFEDHFLEIIHPKYQEYVANDQEYLLKPNWNKVHNLVCRTRHLSSLSKQQLWYSIFASSLFIYYINNLERNIRRKSLKFNGACEIEVLCVSSYQYCIELFKIGNTFLDLLLCYCFIGILWLGSLMWARGTQSY